MTCASTRIPSLARPPGPRRGEATAPTTKNGRTREARSSGPRLLRSRGLGRDRECHRTSHANAGSLLGVSTSSTSATTRVTAGGSQSVRRRGVVGSHGEDREGDERHGSASERRGERRLSGRRTGELVCSRPVADPGLPRRADIVEPLRQIRADEQRGHEQRDRRGHDGDDRGHLDRAQRTRRGVRDRRRRAPACPCGAR